MNVFHDVKNTFKEIIKYKLDLNLSIVCECRNKGYKYFKSFGLKEG